MKKMNKTGRISYFVAGNGADGFRSYYSERFDCPAVTRVYAVKGGPGTGKSRFLQDVATYGEERGWRAEYVLCSSDPHSLDGVLLSAHGECYAFVDATAPHLYEPMHPGVREEIVNLGEFWNVSRLAENREELERLSEGKRIGYRRAYRYLSAAGEMIRERDELVLPYIRLPALRRYAKKLLSDVPMGSGYSVTPSLIRSVGMRGTVALDTYFAHAGKRYLVEDCHGVARYLTDEIGKTCVGLRQPVRISFDPVMPDRTDGLFLESPRIAFVVASPKEYDLPVRRLSLRRFVDASAMRAVRPSIFYAERMHRAMIGGAVEAMDAVRQTHFRMESIYSSAMDFPAKEAFTVAFCHKLFGT